MKLPIRWRFAILYSLLLAVAIGALGIILNATFNRSYLASLENHLFSEARILRNQVTPLIEGGEPFTTLQEEVINYAQLIELRITIILPDGKVIAESDRPLDTLENHLTRPEVQAALQGREASESRYSTTTHQHRLYVAIPVYKNDAVIAVIRLSIPQSYIQANRQMVGRTIAFTILIVMGLTTLLSIFLTRYITRPLNQLTQRVLSLSDTIDLPAARRMDVADEIKQLSTAFDAISTQLTAQISALQNERGKLEAVLANMTDGVIMVDENDRIALINQAALTMFHNERSQSVGRSIVEVVRDHQIVELWKKCKADHSHQTLTIDLLPDRIYLQVIASPLANIGTDFVLLVFQDLTRIRHLETIRRDFVSNVSHELRTPLASLKALAETLQEGALEDPTAARRFLAQMEVEIDNLTQMVQELLELSRIESGKVPLNRNPISPADILQEAFQRMNLQTERAGLSLSVEVQNDLPQVLADAERISQVMLNLVHNAIKFTPPGGRITLRASSRPSDVIFSVQDTGSGISPRDLQRIFERFYKTDRSRSGGGTGLGLSIARHLVEAHGGKIWAESVEGQGSTFFFSLPRAGKKD